MFITVLFSSTSYDTYSIMINSKSDLDVISKTGAIIDHYHNGNLVHILATDNQYTQIQLKGYSINQNNNDALKLFSIISYQFASLPSSSISSS